MIAASTGRRFDVVTRFDRHKMASADPTDLGLIQRVYAQAIAFGGDSADPMQGLWQTALLPAMWWTFRIGLLGSTLFVKPSAFEHAISIMVLVLVGLMCLFFPMGIYFGTFFLPGNVDVIFDRRNMCVHWVTANGAKSTRLSALRGLPLRVVSIHWSQIDAEYRSVLGAKTQSTRNSHDLAFVVHRSAADQTILEEFGLPPTMLLRRETVPALYEHIRRYMEEGGPPWSPGVTEPAPLIPKPKSWWQSMGLVGPFGPKYLQWWKQQPGLTLAVHVLFPITIPIYVLWSLINWLSYATEQKVAWPQKVLNTLGPVLTDDEVRAGKGGKLVA